MSTFEIYQNEVEVIVPEGTGQWQEIDLASSLADPTAKAVIIRVAYFSGLSQIFIGLKGINDDQILFSNLSADNKYITSCVTLAGGTTINLLVKEFSTARFWIVGEIHDHAVLYDTSIHYAHLEEEFNTFIDRQPTAQGGDDIADIGQVIVRGIVDDVFANSTNFGIRQRGSSSPPTSTLAASGTFWYVIGVDENGFYQTYTEGKTGTDIPFVHFYEIGYILKTGSVVTVLNPVEEDPVESWPAWGTLSLASTNQPIDVDAISAGIEWYETGDSGNQAFARAVGSTIFPKRNIEVETPVVQAVAVNKSRQVNYQVRDATIRFFIWWWELLIPAEPGKNAAIRRLDDDPLLSLNLVSREAVSLRLRAPKAVSVSGLRSAAVVSIRRLNDSPRTSVRLKSA